MQQGNRSSNSAASSQDARAQEIFEKAKQKEQSRSKKPQKEDKGPVAFVKGTVKELKLTTWPKPAELLRWCLIVIATVALFAVGSMLVDNFIATPLMYWISSLDVGSQEFGPFDIAVVVLLFLSGIGSIIGVYMHQGGDTEGLSDTMATRLTGGSGTAQKNLDRITLACIVVFVACLVACMVIYPQGSIVGQ